MLYFATSLGYLNWTAPLPSVASSLPDYPSATTPSHNTMGKMAHTHHTCAMHGKHACRSRSNRGAAWHVAVTTAHVVPPGLACSVLGPPCTLRSGVKPGAHTWRRAALRTSAPSPAP